MIKFNDSNEMGYLKSKNKLAIGDELAVVITAT